MDVINVKDYGANGNGVDNDTDAINDAIADLNLPIDPETTASYRALYFPPGSYRFIEDLTAITADNSGVVGAPGAGLLRTDTDGPFFTIEGRWVTVQNLILESTAAETAAAFLI
jgi:hypothetical protein